MTIPSPFRVLEWIVEWGGVYLDFAPWGWWFVILFIFVWTYLVACDLVPLAADEESIMFKEIF